MRASKVLFFLALLMAWSWSEPLCSEEVVDHSRGGAFYFGPGVAWVNMDPVKDLAENDIALKTFRYDFSDETFSLSNFGFYWGQKNGGRGGFVFSGGYKRYRSAISERVRYDSNGVVTLPGGDTATVDSSMDLMVIPVSAGFQFERSWSVKPWLHVFGGGVVGGGMLVLVKQGREGKGGTAFGSEPYAGDRNTDWDEERGPNSDVALAPYWMIQAQAGATASMTRWLHFGLEGFVSGQVASEGFMGAYRNGFNQFVPGLRLRLVLGTLG